MEEAEFIVLTGFLVVVLGEGVRPLKNSRFTTWEGTIEEVSEVNDDLS